jgi:uncharacterized membrane protein YfcA
MVFQTAGIEVAPWIPPLVAFFISFFTSMGGVSGAFLLLPFQMSFLGYTNPSVSATNQLFNIVAIPSGVYRYYREGRMVWPLTWAVILGTLPGVFIGAIIRVAYLPDPRGFKLFAALVLLYIGGRMVLDLVKKPQPAQGKASAEQRFQELVRRHRAGTESGDRTNVEPLPGIQVTRFDLKKVGYDFYGEPSEAPTWGIFALSFVVGIIGGIYGIGGGAIIAPFFVSFFNLPVYTVAGAALMGTFVTSVAGVIFYQAIAPLYPNLSVAPDWLLGILFGIGGMAGMYLGARFQKFVPAKAIKWMLSGIIVFTALKYVLSYFGL